MKIQFWAVGKEHEPYVREGVEDFTRRIRFYFPVEWRLFPAYKGPGTLQPEQQRLKEAAPILAALKPDDLLWVLDERGKELTSAGLAAALEARAAGGTRNLVFLIGGAYGLHTSILDRSALTLSLSRLTFPHQLVRLLLAEQVYRACTILRNEKYHHA